MENYPFPIAEDLSCSASISDGVNTFLMFYQHESAGKASAVREQPGQQPATAGESVYG